MKKSSLLKSKKRKAVYDKLAAMEISLEVMLIKQDMALHDYALSRLIRGH